MLNLLDLKSEVLAQLQLLIEFPIGNTSIPMLSQLLVLILPCLVFLFNDLILKLTYLLIIVIIRPQNSHLFMLLFIVFSLEFDSILKISYVKLD